MKYHLIAFVLFSFLLLSCEKEKSSIRKPENEKKILKLYVNKKYGELLELYFNSKDYNVIQSSKSYLADVGYDVLFPYIEKKYMQKTGVETNTKLLQMFSISLVSELRYVLKNHENEMLGKSDFRNENESDVNMSAEIMRMKKYGLSRVSILDYIPEEYRITMDYLYECMKNDSISKDGYCEYIRLINVVNDKKYIDGIFPYIRKMDNPKKSMRALENLIEKFYTRKEMEGIKIKYGLTKYWYK